MPNFSTENSEVTFWQYHSFRHPFCLETGLGCMTQTMPGSENVVLAQIEGTPHSHVLSHAACRKHSQHIRGINVTAWTHLPPGEAVYGERVLLGIQLLKKSSIIPYCQFWIY